MPDQTATHNFQHLLQEGNPAAAIFAEVNGLLADRDHHKTMRTFARSSPRTVSPS